MSYWGNGRWIQKKEEAVRKGCRESSRRRHSGSIKIETKIMAIRQDAEIRMVPAAVLLQLIPLVVSLKL